MLPSYKAKYESSEVADHQGDSDDEYEKKDKCTLSQVLAECKAEWIFNEDNRRLMDLLSTELEIGYAFIKKCDKDKRMGWEVCHRAAEINAALLKNFEKHPSLLEVPKLWMPCWKKFHHPVYSLAYNFAPEYHAAKPWTSLEVKQDTELMLANVDTKYFPDADQRGSARAAMLKYQNFEGCFAKVNAEGHTRI